MPSLMDFFTGNNMKTANQRTFDAYQLGADKARTGALGALGTANQDANAALNFGYEDARGAIDTSNLRAWDVLNQVGTENKGYLDAGRDAALGASRGAIKTITDLYQPYVESGRQAQALYGTLLGLDGAEAARAAAVERAGINSPGLAYMMEMSDKANRVRTNQGGYIGSAREAMVRERARNEMTYRDYQDYLTRLENQAGRGAQYTGQLAGFNDNAANREANIQNAWTQGNVNNTTRHGQTISQMLTQNPYATGQLSQNLGGSRAQLATNYGNNIAGIETGYHQGIAGAQGNLYQGNAAAGTAGMNNILKAGTAAAQMAMGMPPTALVGGQQPVYPQQQQGPSPLGRLWNYFSPGKTLGDDVSQGATNQAGGYM